MDFENEKNNLENFNDKDLTDEKIIDEEEKRRQRLFEIEKKTG